MCLKGAWAELTVKVTSGAAFQSAAHGEKELVCDSQVESFRQVLFVS